MISKARKLLEEIKLLHTNDKAKVSETFVQIEVTKKFSELLVELAEESTANSKRAEKIAWAIVFLTTALVLFTMYLSYDAYNRAQLSNQEKTEQIKH